MMKQNIRSSKELLEETKNKFIQGCDSAIAWTIDQDYSIKVTNLTSINTKYSEACPMFFKEQLVYSSNKESTIIKTTDGFNEEPYYGIYVSKPQKGNKWEKPKRFFASLNTVEHETAVSFSSDFKKVYITRGARNVYSKEVNDNTNRMKLYQSEWGKNRWSKPQYFILNDSSYSFGHSSFADNDNVFVFASDMSGGYGGVDLYITFKVDDSWSKPLNLGEDINTEKDELYPYYLDDGNLYFSSNGHIGFGGFDIYNVNIKEADGVPHNMKTPINSSYDDFSFVIQAKKEKGYLSSNRPNGQGKEDLYEVLFVND